MKRVPLHSVKLKHLIMDYKNYISQGVKIQQTIFGEDKDEKEIHLLLNVTDPLQSFEKQARLLQSICNRIEQMHSAVSVIRRFFVSDATTQTDEVMKLTRDGNYAVSVVNQPPANNTKVAMWAYLKTNAASQTLRSGINLTASPSCSQLWATNMTHNIGLSDNQTVRIIKAYVAKLSDEGAYLDTNCQRTWIYVRDIDNNYAGMAKGRNKAFREQGLTTDTHFIASTGIEGSVADPKALVSMDAVAYQGMRQSDIQYLHADGHMNRTSDYGVSFERGTAIHMKDRTQVFISGTASIDKEGHVCHEGDVLKQADRMMENINALLAEAKCSQQDIQMAVVYLRDMADAAIIEDYLEKHYPHLPHLLLHAAVCRPAWLIEMECMAMRS